MIPSLHRIGTPLLGLVALAACDSPSGPRPPQPLTLAEALDSLVRAEQPRQAPGVAVLVRVGDSLLVESGYGQADAERGVPATAATPFQAGSVTKQVTAAAVLRLAEQGRVRLDDDVRKHLPELDTRGHTVTLHHLLTHTSGMPEYTELFRDFATPVPPRQVLDSIVSRPFRFAPGDQWAYSNSGYFLLGLVIERASGRSYAAYLAELFFQPLGMSRTSVCGTAPNAQVPAGYHIPAPGAARVRLEPITMTLVGAAGALCSTVGDLDRWQRALHGGELLSAASYAAMTAPTRLRGGGLIPYGYGLQLDAYLGERLLHHNGAIPGFQSQLAYYPGRRLGIVVLTNQWPSSPEALERRIAQRVLRP